MRPWRAGWRASRKCGWARYLSLPRYKLVVLRAIVAKGLARRERAFHGKELVLDFLFPEPPPHEDEQSKPGLPHELFSIICRYYWGGGMSAEEETAAAAEAAAAKARQAAAMAAMYSH